jgi:hypothetical protein
MEIILNATKKKNQTFDQTRTATTEQLVLTIRSDNISKGKDASRKTNRIRSSSILRELFTEELIEGDNNRYRESGIQSL